MGKFDFEIDPKFLKALGKMSDVEKFAPKMINESTPIVEKGMQREIQSKLGKYSQDDMVKSIKATKAKLTKKGGYYAYVRPTGRDKKGMRNMEKLVYFENGTKTGQPARPVIVAAKKSVESEVIDKMQEVFNREMGK